MAIAPQYVFEASEKPSLPLFDVPLVEATNDSLRGYGCLVDDWENFDIEIVRRPVQGWRGVDDGTGDEAGCVEGIFHCEWRGDVLRGRNDAVGGDYVLGWSRDPRDARGDRQSVPRDRVLLWHMNYHPDGGQLFFSLERKPFVVPVAMPGDDLKPQDIVAMRCDGSLGLYIHPNIWHEGVFSAEDTHRFRDRQGRVHARVSCDIGMEFGVYLSVPLQPNGDTA